MNLLSGSGRLVLDHMPTAFTNLSATVETGSPGYVIVYVDNQTIGKDVWFDDVQVLHYNTRVLEENHYYPYGLPIQGWGTVATGSLPNRQRYQGNEYREEAGLNWMDFHNRQYDPQLGRFLGVDALADAGGQQVLSPYHAMACNPALMVDPLGLQSGKSDPTPGSLLTSGNNPGTSGWGAVTGYYRSTLGSQPRPAELQGMLGAMAMMRILSGDAAGAASRMSPGGGSSMSSYEQMVQLDSWQRQWRRYASNRSENQKNILDAFSQLVYNLNNGFDVLDEKGNLIRTVLDEHVVLGIAIPLPLPFPGLSPYPGTYPELPSWEGTRNWFKHNTPDLHPIHLIQELSLTVADIVTTILYSKGGNQNKWPTHYGDPPTAKNTDWGKSDSQLADEAAARVGDTKRGPGTAHNEAKKTYNKKRPK